LVILNLPDVRGFDGPGQYLLLLNPESFFLQNQNNPQDQTFTVVGQQRSPGNDLTGVGKPIIYRWSDDVRKEYESLHR
jgi:hypothetical protein